ncbi:iron chelate uptake ABC transporter family permease subunit [Microbacterium luteolum]|uniref:Iron chelate uptake ABC transporter family permease subunit n=1 Tax=Microbacterium luteolum TaxID=69367 RepID=A0ABY7XL38_MICLT|nr:iron chelate uptake ABC transporter family permease subunit [Microbacterium luteolum]
MPKRSKTSTRPPLRLTDSEIAPPREVAEQPVQTSEAADNARAAISVSRRRRMLGFALAVGALATCILLSFTIGSQQLSIEQIVAALQGADSEAWTIIRDLRGPRTALGILVGAALGIAGALMQAFTRNPLADPGILGVNAGAAFAVAAGAAAFGITTLSGTIWFALLGAVATTFAVWAIGASGRRGVDPLRITLAGVAIGAFLSGITSGITLLLPEVFDRMRGWNAGSIASTPSAQIGWVLPFLLVGFVLAFAVARPLNAVALGDDLAVSLGSRIVRTRVLAIIAATLLCAAATAVAGPIGFVGLMVPHAVRWFTGPDQRWIFAGSLIAAPVLVLASDIVGRVVLRSGELPVGIVTAFVGAPVLIMLVRRRGASAL